MDECVKKQIKKLYVKGVHFEKRIKLNKMASIQKNVHEKNFWSSQFTNVT